MKETSRYIRLSSWLNKRFLHNAYCRMIIGIVFLYNNGSATYCNGNVLFWQKEVNALLSERVDVLKGIGKKTKEDLALMNIHTIEDLLYYFPYRYDIQGAQMGQD